MTMYRVVASSGFARDLRKLAKRDTALFGIVDRCIHILETDPFNRTSGYHIKKLGGLKAGEGQWRIRVGEYRLRYDIFEGDVLLYSFRHRKDAYR